MGQITAVTQDASLRPWRTEGLKKVAVLAGLIVISLLLYITFNRPSKNTSLAYGVAWRMPRPLADHRAASNSNCHGYNWALTARTFWEEQAIANLSNFRATLLSNVRPLYGKIGFWKVFLPVISCPPSRPLTRYGGEGDGSKLLCSLPKWSSQDACVIYSLGSNGDYAFERSMLNETSCEIHTFDCTYKDGKSQHRSRHFYHQWCVGDPQHGKQYRTWKNITASLGHHRVSLLKMDVEGYEHEVLPAWRPDDILADELSMEFHTMADKNWPGTVPELGLSFMHLANLGYATYSVEVNPLGPECCAEVTFMRLGH